MMKNGRIVVGFQVHEPISFRVRVWVPGTRHESTRQELPGLIAVPRSHLVTDTTYM